jgi:hypothetical protein
MSQAAAFFGESVVVSVTIRTYIYAKHQMLFSKDTGQRG